MEIDARTPTWLAPHCTWLVANETLATAASVAVAMALLTSSRATLEVAPEPAASMVVPWVEPPGRTLPATATAPPMPLPTPLPMTLPMAFTRPPAQQRTDVAQSIAAPATCTPISNAASLSSVPDRPCACAELAPSPPHVRAWSRLRAPICLASTLLALSETLTTDGPCVAEAMEHFTTLLTCTSPGSRATLDAALEPAASTVP